MLGSYYPFPNKLNHTISYCYLDDDSYPFTQSIGINVKTFNPKYPPSQKIVKTRKINKGAGLQIKFEPYLTYQERVKSANLSNPIYREETVRTNRKFKFPSDK